MKTTWKALFLFSFLLMSALLTAQSLVNPNATPETKSLMAFLREVYGKKILSGQCVDTWLPLIQQKTGKQPAILALDFGDKFTSQKETHEADKAIDWVRNKGGIIQFQWHWISPDRNGDFYTKNFNLKEAMDHPEGESYQHILRDMDVVAGEIKKMQDAHVPILWRPLHESEGAWFWWGMSGKEPLIKLYRLMYDRFVNVHKLNNIIWIWNSYGSDKGNWCPGDDVCDIIAWDYETNNAWDQFQQLFAAKGKIFALAEVSELPDPKKFAVHPWSFFICWDYMIQDPAEPNIDPYNRAAKNATSWTKAVYSDSTTLNLDDLKKYNVYGRTVK